MKIKNVKLEWYILQYDSNTNKPIIKNIFNDSFPQEVAKKIKKGKKDNWNPVYNYETFKEWIKNDLMYYYWSKTEAEIYIADWYSSEKHKIDGWFQIEPNLDNICEMIINKMQIEFYE